MVANKQGLILLIKALEKLEDRYLSKIALKLDKKQAKTYSHDEVWGNINVICKDISNG